MSKIEDIFFNGDDFERENIIKKVNIDWDKHAKGIYNLAKSLEPRFEIKEHTKTALRLLLQYFTGNENFITEAEKLGVKNASLSKGIMLIGGVGSGKTLMFDIFRIYTSEILHVNSFQKHISMNIVNNTNMKGIEYLDIFNVNDGRPITCYIDDIAGSNEVIKHFGTEINVIEQLLLTRYNIYKRYDKLTHTSTNKYPAELKEIYDGRVIDRMKEMFNFIELDAKSFRK